VVSLVAAGTDAQDAADNLMYQWDVSLLENQRVHSHVLTTTGRTASFAAHKPDDAGEVAYRVQLVVTDSGRMRDTATVTIRPRAQVDTSSPVAAGDVLQVQVYAGGEKQEDFTAEISRAGTITSPLIGEVNVSGLRTTEIGDKLRRVLAKDFFVDPQVLVSVKTTSGKVYVSGEVRRPGVYDLTEGLRVLNACVLAGGFTNYAALNKVRITRTEDGHARTIQLDLAKVQRGKKEDLLLQSGDRIDVPPRRF
jgi:polysaccharide export outer membrane protein